MRWAGAMGINVALVLTPAALIACAVKLPSSVRPSLEMPRLEFILRIGSERFQLVMRGETIGRA